jgi:hypothetical protein
MTRTYPEGGSIIPPGRELAHYTGSPRAKESEVDQSIPLFPKTFELGRFPNIVVVRDRATDVEGNGLADERPHDDVVRDEDKVEPALAIAGVRLVICW